MYCWRAQFEFEDTLMRKLFTLCSLIVLLAAVPASAQFDTASVVGTVRDSSGAVVPDATVTLTHTATGLSSVKTTNAAGLYEFVTVKPGAYVITAEKAGFALALVDN